LAGEKTVTISVKTGKVLVFDKNIFQNQSGNEASGIVLAPNQEVILTNAQIRTPEKVEPLKNNDLKPVTNHKLIEYDDANVTAVLQQLEESYGFEIDFNEKDLVACLVTCSFLEENFQERLEVICKAIGAEYYIQNEVVKVTSPGCR
jgi:hypothetical protein